MNKEEIEAAKQILETVSFLPESFTDYGGYIVIAGYLKQALQENERLQAIIWECVSIADSAYYDDYGYPRLLPDDVIYLRRILSQALKEQEEGE